MLIPALEVLQLACSAERTRACRIGATEDGQDPPERMRSGFPEPALAEASTARSGPAK